MGKIITILLAAMLAGLLVWLGLGSRAHSADPSHAVVPETLSFVAHPARRGSTRFDAQIERALSERRPQAFFDALLDQQCEAQEARVEAVTVKGRCIDSVGQPLAGVTVHVEPMRIALPSGEVPGAGPRLPSQDFKTGADGTFALACALPPALHVSIALKRDDRAGLSGVVAAAKGESVLELGDLVMVQGSRVRGRVVDLAGAPQEGVHLSSHLFGHDLADARITPKGFSFARTQADGRFVFEDCLTPGMWTLDLDGRVKLAPDVFEVREDAAETVVQVLVERGEVETITGTVVDEQGVPVRSIPMIVAGERSRAVWDGTGSFRLENRELHPAEAVRIEVLAAGFEPFTTEESHAWGTRDLRLVLRRGLAVEVRATDASTGDPIEEYGVRVLPEPGPRDARRQIHADCPLWEKAWHQDGVCVVRGLTPGRHRLAIEPAGTTWGPSELITVDVGDARVPRLEARLGKAVARTVRVERDGLPVAGAKVELVLGMGRALGATTQVVWRQQLGWWASAPTGPPDLAAREALTVTGANGEASLSGSDRLRYALRVTGALGTAFVRDVVLGEARDPIAIQMPVGATVRGRITPASLVGQLRREISLTSSSDRLPGVHAVRWEGDRLITHPADVGQTAPLGDDGTFLVQGVPEGTWELRLDSWRWESLGNQSRSGVIIANVEGLRDGDVREVDVDLGDLFGTVLRGRVDLDGAPYRGRLAVNYRRDSTGGDPWEGWIETRTDADGAFVVTCPAGRARVVIRRPHWRGGSMGDAWPMLCATALCSDERIALAHHDEVDAEFHVRTSRVRLRVRAAAGVPAPGVRFDLVREDEPDHQAFTRSSDAEGVVPLLVNPGSWRVRAVRKGYARVETYGELNGLGEWECRALVEVGAFIAEAGGTEKVIDLTLPAEAGY